MLYVLCRGEAVHKFDSSLAVNLKSNTWRPMESETGSVRFLRKLRPEITDAHPQWQVQSLSRVQRRKFYRSENPHTVLSKAETAITYAMTVQNVLLARKQPCLRRKLRSSRLLRSV